jgi:hypothetical protein
MRALSAEVMKMENQEKQNWIQERQHWIQYWEDKIKEYEPRVQKLDEIVQLREERLEYLLNMKQDLQNEHVQLVDKIRKYWYLLPLRKILRRNAVEYEQERNDEEIPRARWDLEKAYKERDKEKQRIEFKQKLIERFDVENRDAAYKRLSEFVN